VLLKGNKVKVSDLGLARKVPMDPEDATCTARTKIYIAPEALNGDYRKADMYSLGVILCQLVLEFVTVLYDFKVPLHNYNYESKELAHLAKLAVQMLEAKETCIWFPHIIDWFHSTFSKVNGEFFTVLGDGDRSE